MNLWIDARMISCSGIGTVITNLIRPLSSAPFSTTLIAHPNAKLNAYSCKPCAAPIYSIREQIELPRFIPHCDLFWSPHYNIPVLPIRAKKRIVTIHDAYHLAFKETLGWKQRLYAKTMFWQAVCRSDGIITDSLFSQNELHRLLSVSRDRIRVIYPGVDFDRFSRPVPLKEREALRRKYSLPESFFLFVGNIKPHKNLRLILDAYERNRIDIPLVAIGKISGRLQIDPSLQRIGRSPQLSSKVFVIGKALDEELSAFYQMATSLVFPSLYEGFGLPPLEAMAAGCPAIVSSRASLPEVCGDAAHYLYSNQPEELAATMLQVAQDASLRKSLQEKGVKQARRFSWVRTAAQYRDVFKEIYFR